MEYIGSTDISLPYKVCRVYDNNAMADKIESHDRELLLIKDSYSEEFNRLNDQILSLGQYTKQIKREVDSVREEIADCQNEINVLNEEVAILRETLVDVNNKRKRDDHVEEPVVVDGVLCPVCEKTKPIEAFQLKQTKKDANGMPIPASTYTKTRKTCKACYARKYRENKKAKTA